MKTVRKIETDVCPLCGTILRDFGEEPAVNEWTIVFAVSCDCGFKGFEKFCLVFEKFLTEDEEPIENY